MSVATMTTKGQITIPKEIRESLGINAGDKIEIVVADQNRAILRPLSKKVDEIFGMLHNPSRAPVNLEEMKEGIRNRMKEKFK